MKRGTLGCLLCGLLGVCLGGVAGSVATALWAPEEPRALSAEALPQRAERAAAPVEARRASPARRRAARRRVAPGAAFATQPGEPEAVPETRVEAQPLSPEAEARFAAAWRQAAERWAARRAEGLDFLAAVDPGLLSHEEASAHASYLQTLGRLQELRAEIAVMAWEERPVPFEWKVALSEAEQSLRAAARAERALLLRALARSLELNEDEVGQFSAITEAILNATEGM